MVPDTRMSQFWMTMAMILNEICARVFAAVQHEAHSDSHVPFSGNELRAVQEDGDIRKC
jgi:hypothetical protein